MLSVEEIKQLIDLEFLELIKCSPQQLYANTLGIAATAIALHEQKDDLVEVLKRIKDNCEIKLDKGIGIISIEQTKDLIDEIFKKHGIS